MGKDSITDKKGNETTAKKRFSFDNKSCQSSLISGIVAERIIFHRLSFGIVGESVGPSGCKPVDRDSLSYMLIRLGCVSEST